MTELILTGNIHDPRRALVLVHGRGATAESMIQLVPALALRGTVVVLAPQAPANSWYPARFIVPHADNQPYLDEALLTISESLKLLENRFGITKSDTVLAGFSQGACLVAEFLKRHPGRYKAAALWSGALIGSETEVQASVDGSFDGTPIYLGCDAHDPHIPAERVHSSARYFEEHRAVVTCTLYAGLGHTVHPDGLRFVEEYLQEE